MKILVIGATGLIGRNVTSKLVNAGHHVIAGSRSTGIDIITGEGLPEALEGTEVVIDLSNSTSPEDELSNNFFRTAGQNLARIEKAAGVKHHLILSIVGTDLGQHIGYLRAKKVQEDLIKESGIPYTIIRATQFHEHITTLIAVQSQDREVHISTVDYQPIAAEDVAAFIAATALEAPVNSTIDIAGPERAPMTAFVERYLAITGEDKVLVPNDDNKYMFFDIEKSGLVPAGDFVSGKISFNEWIENNIQHLHP